MQVREEVMGLPAQIIFTGRVYPERTYITISALEMILADTWSGINGILKLSICSSQISAVFHSEFSPADLMTLRNRIVDAVRLQLDIFGYVNGWYLDLEISQAVVLGTRETVFFGVNIDGIATIGSWSFQQLLPIFADKRSDYLRRCFSDLRSALKYPSDTGELCYRAIEVLRKYFVDENQIDDKSVKGVKDSWVLMGKKLGIGADSLTLIKEYAVDERHGGTKFISGEKRLEIYSATWAIVDKFIAFSLNGYK